MRWLVDHVGTYVLFGLLAIAIILIVWAIVVSRRARILFLISIVVAVGLWVARRMDWGWAMTLQHKLAAVSGWVAVHIGPAFEWVIKLAVSVALVLALVLLLAQIGSTWWTPLSAGFGAGKDLGSMIDLAAGSSVAVSIACCSAVVNIRFRTELTQALDGNPTERVATSLIGIHEFLIPDSSEVWLKELLRGVSGFPEFAIVVLSVLIGCLSLTRRSVAELHPGYAATVVLALGKVTLAVALALPALLAAAILSTDSS